MRTTRCAARKIIWRTLAVGVSASIVLSGCGGSKDSGGSADGPIVIGAALSLTGTLATSAAHSKRAYDLWVKERNADGGLLGRNVKLKIYDDQSDPATSTRLYERLITQDKVDLVVGPFGSAASAAAATAAERNKMPMLLPLAASDAIFERNYKYVFQAITPSTNYFTGAYQIAAGEGYKTAACIGRDYEAARVICDSLKETQAEEYGLKLVYAGYYPEGTTDYSSVVRKLQQKDPDLIVCTCYAPEMIELTNTMDATKYSPPMLISNGAAQPEFIKGAGEAANGQFVSTQYEPELKTPGNETFVATYEKAYGEAPSYYDAFSWASLELLAKAVDSAKSLDLEKLRGEISSLKTDTIVGPFAVDGTGKQTAAQSFIAQIRDGQRKLVWPKEMSEEGVQLILPMAKATS